MNGENVSLRNVLLQAGRRIKLSALLVGVSWWLVTCLGIWLALFVLDNLLRLPAGLRLPLALGGAAITGLSFARKIYTVASQKLRVERTAVLLEKRYGVPENALINACQFEGRQFRPEEVPFARQTVALAAQHAGSIQISDLWNKRELLRWGGAAAVLLALWCVYLIGFPHLALNAGARFVLPLADRPPAASVQLFLNPSSDITIVEGENVEIKLAVRGKDLGSNPTLVWKEAAQHLEASPTAGDNVMMAAEPQATNLFTYTFAEVRRPFAFRAFAGDAYTRSVQVRVKPLPRLAESFFRVTPPAYTGMGAVTNPGPPAPLSVLPGSKAELALGIDSPVSAIRWIAGGQTNLFVAHGKLWQTAITVTQPGEYEIEVTAPGLEKPVSIARGAVRLETDQPPEVDFLTSDRNRLVNLGSSIKLDVQASDDYGLRAIEVTVRTPDSETPQRIVKAWTYIGPPGPKGPVKETCSFVVDPQFFKPDQAYLLEALAADFRPDGKPGKSRPIMLRVKSLDSYSPPADDPLAGGFAALRSAIFYQERSLNRTANLKTYLDEAVKNRTVPQRAKEIAKIQTDAHKAASQALKEFRKHDDGRLYAAALDPLVNGEIPFVLRELDELGGKKNEQLPGEVAAIEERQTYILTEMQALLGKIADNKQKLALTNAFPKEIENTPMVTPEQMAKDLADDLKKFINEQERIIERSKALMDKRGEDLTDKEEQILGDLAREESKWAKYFEEKLTDWSKLPPQDFADGKMSKELNEVFQEIKMAASNLWAQKTELAVPAEQSGLENAKELEQNLERWLPDSPDRVKWNMEEAANMPADVAMAELPNELEDIVGELIDKEEDMTQDVEDVTSPWMDSIDKGAGWGAMDGPISSMSAKGVTGNMLPNQMEIGGRSGEGRTGRSSGQMVEETAEGKGGRDTPSRLTPTPFEQGSVKDSDTKSLGGATGGGKLSGAGAEGLRGPNSPQLQQKLPRLADNQAKIRQEAEALALKLRQYKLPTGNLEASITAMRKFEDSARKGDGIGVRRAFSQAVDLLGEAKQSLRQETGLHRERVKLPPWYRDEIKTGLSDGVPRGYEEMVSEYFKTLAEQKTAEKK